MHSKDITNMSEADHAAWLAEATGIVDASAPNEHNLTNLFSEALREDNPALKADLLVQTATMCLALADATLGYKGCATTCLEITKH